MELGRATVITLVVIIFLVGGLSLQLVNSQPWFCNSCHEMNFNYNSWQSSTHGQEAVCVDCHSEPGLRGLIEDNVRGAEQFAAHLSGNYEMPIQIKNRVKNDQCLACHPETRNLTDSTIDAKHSLHMVKNVLCVDCHNHIVHNQSGQLRVMALDQCDTCHKKHTNLDLGKHVEVNCDKCHPGGNYTGTDHNCEFCHEVPANHSVEIATDCDMCHNLAGWKPAKLDHSKFPLIEKHQSLKCTQCHIDGIYQGTAAACADCHEPPLSHAGMDTDCDMCHNVTGWKPAKLDHSRFPLIEKHQSLKCNQCHMNEIYQGTATACVDCHESPLNHAGMDTDCVQCHNIGGFKPANFKHKYVGEHMGAGAEHRVLCIRCHPVRFKEATCTECHGSNNPVDD